MTNIKKLLKSYEIYVTDALNPNLRHTIKNMLQSNAFQVYGGQKRLVVEDETGTAVYKVATDGEGIQDNINEVAVSDRLKELAQQGVINAQDLALFALAEVVDGDPIIIKQARGIQFEDFAAYSQYLDSRNVDKTQPTARYMTEFVINNDRYSKECERIAQIMSEHFVPSDISITHEPLNYGFNPNNNGLMLFDMGSVLPIFKDMYGNEASRPRCPHCGANSMKYVPLKIAKGTNLNTLQTIKGRYGCANRACSHSILVKSVDFDAPIPIGEEDYTVFREWLNTHPSERNLMNLIHGYKWMPYNPSTIHNMLDLKRDIDSYAFMGMTQIGNADLNKVWANYLITEAAKVLQIVESLDNIPVTVNNSVKTFGMFVQDISTGLSTVGFSGASQAVLKALCALLYVRKLSTVVNNPGLYADLVLAYDFTVFRDVVNSNIQGLPHEDIFMLFNCLRGVM